MITTLGARYGTGFEREVIRLFLADRTFAEASISAFDEGMFADADVRILVGSISKLAKNASGIIPTAPMVQADLTARKAVLDEKGQEARSAAVGSATEMLCGIVSQAPLTASEVEFIRTHFGTFVTYRNTQIALLECVDLVEAGEFDQVRELVNHATESGRLCAFPNLGLDFSDVRAKLLAYMTKKQNKFGAPTGIVSLDRILNGGLEPGTLGIFMAPPGIGKTMAMISSGVQALLKGMHVVHVTLEISAAATALRYDARLLGYPINDIANNLKRYAKQILQSTQRITARLYIQEWGSDEASVLDLRAYLKMLQIKRGIRPQLILVDYADLLKPIKARKDMLRMELGDTMRGLRQVARDFECAIWTGSQVSKAGYDADVQSLSYIAESGEKAAVSDVIIGLCQTPTERKTNRMRLVVLKNRNGGREHTVIDCIVDTSTQTMVQAPTQAGYVLGKVQQKGSKPGKSTP